MADDDENDEFDENVEADDMFEYVVSQVCKHKALQCIKSCRRTTISNFFTFHFSVASHFTQASWIF